MITCKVQISDFFLDENLIQVFTPWPLVTLPAEPLGPLTPLGPGGPGIPGGQVTQVALGTL